MLTRVIAYVDGFNLYFGLKSQRLSYGYWLDIPKLLCRYIRHNQTLTATKYFTSRVTAPPDKARRQNEYIEALTAQPGVAAYYGQYQSHTKRCFGCGATWPEYGEKMTDVNIAVELLTDAIEDRYDAALLVSADSDLSAPIHAVRRLRPDKRIIAVFPPGRGSTTIQSLVHEKRRITAAAVEACQLPEFVTGLDGFKKRRPFQWTAYPITAGEPNPAAIGTAGTDSC